MKKQLALLIAIFFIQNASFAQTTYTWNALVAGSASNGLNWLPLTGPPLSGDNVLFNGTSTADCTWDITTINSFSVLSGYTGSISMGSTSRNIRKDIVINSGTVTSTSGTLTKSLIGTASVFQLGAGGTFNHNSGTFLLQLESTDNYSFSGDIVLNSLTFGIAATTGERSINFGSNLSVNTLQYSGAVDPISFQGTIHIKTSFNLSAATYTDVLAGTNNANFIFDGTNANIIGATGAGMTWLPNVQINTTGTYAISNHLNIQGNWTGTQGTLTVGSSTQNFYGTSAAINGTAAAFDNLNIQSGAVVSMPTNAEVKIGGSLTRTGTLNFQSTTALGLNAPGANSQSLVGGFTLAGINSYSTGSSRAITITGSMINILDSLKIEDGITFNTGGLITLKSTNALTARIAEIGTGGSVNGNATVETFIPGGTTGWANLGVRGVTGQTIANWDTYVSSSGANGLPMTCVGCAYSPTIIGTGSNSFVSVQGWDETSNTYTELTSTVALTPGLGFWVYVGDGPSTTNGMTLVNTGSVVHTSTSIPLSVAGTPTTHYNLVSNPFASPISWTKVMSDFFNASNAIDVIHVWNADLGVTTSYNTTIGSSHGTGGITDIIPAGQAFYVEAVNSGFGNNLTFYENMKTTGNTSSNPLLKTAANNVQFFRLKVAGSVDWDEAAFATHSAATKAFDRNLDAHKFFQSPGYAGYPGAYTKYTSISSKDASNEDYSINTFPPLTNSVSIPVLVRVSTSGTYTITAKDFQNFTTCVGLIDKLDNSYHDLRSNPYVCAINDTTSAPRFELVLCRDQSLNLVSVAEAEQSQAIFINQDQQSAYVKTEFAQNTKAVISAFNILGQKLMEDVLVEGKTTTTRLNLDLHNQVVIIKVTTAKESSTKKIVLH